MRIRIIAKRDGKGWGVYDRERGSWPQIVAGFGEVGQHFKLEEDAQAMADQLDEFYRTT